MVPVVVVADAAVGAGTVGDVVALLAAAAMGAAAIPDADEANAEPSVMAAAEVTSDEVVASGDCTYPSIGAERSYRLDYFSTDSTVRRKFLPLALRWVTPERASAEVAQSLTTIAGCS